MLGVFVQRFIKVKDFACIMGMGDTGISCLRFLRALEIPCCIMDSRANPMGLQRILEEFPDVPYTLGGWRHDWLLEANQIIVSPGIALSEPCLQEADKAGISIIGDIELFAKHAKAPIIGITGTNGKTTVTTLVGELLTAAGKRVSVGGNLGPPALELLTEDAPEVYVIELSSFQLQSTQSLQCEAATILNCSPDHMDWHPSFKDYKQAKKSIYRRCHTAVCPRYEPDLWPARSREMITYGADKPDGPKSFGLSEHLGEMCLVWGERVIIPAASLKLNGPCPEINALAGCALASVLGVSIDVMASVLKSFSGLPHRCEWVLNHHGVDWYNDSKGTNIGATLAAIKRLTPKYQGVILMVGGIGKGADFGLMRDELVANVKHVIFFGQDGLAIQSTLGDDLSGEYVSTLSEAVQRASELAQSGEAVLFSPSCASLDAFENFAHRGNVYKQLVQDLVCS